MRSRLSSDLKGTTIGLLRSKSGCKTCKYVGFFCNLKASCTDYELESEGSNAGRRSLTVCDAPVQAANANMMEKSPANSPLPPQRCPFSLIHSRCRRTRCGANDALLPTISRTPHQLLAVGWTLTSGAPLSHKSVGANLLSGTPSSP